MLLQIRTEPRVISAKHTGPDNPCGQQVLCTVPSAGHILNLDQRQEEQTDGPSESNKSENNFTYLE